MLIWFVILYLMVSVGIGLWAATRVHNAKDYAVAGRHLPLPVVTATVFATWFGAETVLGISATFVREGLSGTASDPFGASLCLILAGLFFARKLYRLNLLTIGDFFRLRYNRSVEVICTICIVLSYLGWVSAQIKALGLVFNIITEEAVSQQMGMVIGAAIVLTYTTFGGMLSVAALDFVQMIVIMLGMAVIAVIVGDEVGGVSNVIAQAAAQGKFDFWPQGGWQMWVPFLGAWLTMMLGSIPQQDVFQRMTSAKDENTAVRGSVLGGSLYFLFAFVPMLLAFAATLVDPAKFNVLVMEDSQKVLPVLILEHTPVYAQIIFFGALLSAIMSCSSATLLAPSITFSENIIKGFYPHMSDKKFLRVMRGSLVVFTICVLLFALNTDSSIHKMVESAYKVTLVAAFIPLLCGLYWKRATTQGALMGIIGGLMVWILCEVLQPSDVWPAQIIGLGVAIVGMIAGSMLPQWIKTHRPDEHGHHPLHHHHYAHTHEHLSAHGVKHPQHHDNTQTQ